MTGLEFKLKGIDIGDLILLKSEEPIEVSGYVHKISGKKVKLSMLSPFNDYDYVSFMKHYNFFIKNFSKSYRLKYFDDYKILKKHKTRK